MSSSGFMIASGAFGAGNSLATGYSQAQAIKAAGSYQAAIAETNASMANVESEQTLEQGDIAASRKNLETREAVGAELAKQGASGVSVGSGSAALSRAGTNLVGTTDELTIRNNARRAAFGYQVQATQDTYQAKFARMTASQQAMQSLISGGLQAIETPLTIGSNYLRYARYFGGGGGSSASVPDSYFKTGS